MSFDRVNVQEIEPFLQKTFINMKFFATSDDFDIVSVMIPPPGMGADADACRIRCMTTGKVAGRMMDQES